MTHDQGPTLWDWGGEELPRRPARPPQPRRAPEGDRYPPGTVRARNVALVVADLMDMGLDTYRAVSETVCKADLVFYLETDHYRYAYRVAVRSGRYAQDGTVYWPTTGKENLDAFAVVTPDGIVRWADTIDHVLVDRPQDMVPF